MDPHSHALRVGDRVKILTPANGCYDGAVGVVVEKLDGGMDPYLPGQTPAIPHFYRIRTDIPVDIGDGKLVQEDVHPHNQVFAEDSPVKNYWNIKPKGER